MIKVAVVTDINIKLAGGTVDILRPGKGKGTLKVFQAIIRFVANRRQVLDFTQVESMTTGLNHEFRNHAMKYRADISAIIYISQEVGDADGRLTAV